MATTGCTRKLLTAIHSGESRPMIRISIGGNADLLFGLAQRR